MPQRYGARRRANALSRRRRAGKSNRCRCHSGAYAHNRGHTARRSAAGNARTGRNAGRHSRAVDRRHARTGRRIHHARSNKNAACKHIALHRQIYAHARTGRSRNPARQIADAKRNFDAHSYANADAHFDARAQIGGDGDARTHRDAVAKRNRCKRFANANADGCQNRRGGQRSHANPNAAANRNRCARYNAWGYQNGSFHYNV